MFAQPRKVALANDAGQCRGSESGCCGVSAQESMNILISTRSGYSNDEIYSFPEAIDMAPG